MRNNLFVLPRRLISQGAAAQPQAADKAAQRAKKYSKRYRGDIFTADSPEAEVIRKEKREKREAKEEQMFREQMRNIDSIYDEEM